MAIATSSYDLVSEQNERKHGAGSLQAAWVGVWKCQCGQQFNLSNLLHNSLLLLSRALRTASWIFFSCSLSIRSMFPFAVIIEPEYLCLLLLPLYLWSDRSITNKLLMVEKNQNYYDVDVKAANLFNYKNKLICAKSTQTLWISTETTLANYYTNKHNL